MTRTSRVRGRRGGLAMAAVVLLAAGCERTAGQHVAPAPGTPGTVLPVPSSGSPGAEQVRDGERRPDRTSFLVRAETCARFGDAARAVALQDVGPYGFAGDGAGFTFSSERMPLAEATTMAGPSPAAAAAGKEVAGAGFSGTNVQEAGVDEPDVVKTDGHLLVTTVDGHLRVVDVTGAPRQVGTLDLPDGPGDLLLVGRRALVLSNPGISTRPGGPIGRSVPAGTSLPQPGGAGPARPATKVTVVDLADPARPVIARTHTLDGALLDARLIGGVARIVTRSSPSIGFPQAFPQGQQELTEARDANRRLVGNAGAAAFLPAGASCADAYVPVEAAGVGTVAVQSLDPAADAPGPAVTVLADASTVYASATRLFVATNRVSGGPVQPARGPVAGSVATGRTAIHAFDITDPAKARYVGSGDVPGRLLSSFSLSEDAGALRVATTLDPGGVQGAQEAPVPSRSRVTILRPAGDAWVETGAVDGLGKGERIYAVRFLGPVGYVVTFRQTDPLYVLDLRDVHAPKVSGELKITGYSAYLHPAGQQRLLGIGQEATEQGRRAGTQLSLFDVGDPAAPAKLAGAVLRSATSEAEVDHHAFLFWPATGLVVAPVRSYPGPMLGPNGPPPALPFVGAVAFRVGDRTVTEAGRITHPGSAPIERSLVVGDRLLTLSSAGLAANDLTTLASGGFLTFR